MPRAERPRRDWELTGSTLEGLLDCLGADRTLAGERYEQIRRKLIKIFEWRGCAFPEDLADETINRVAHKLEDGVELPEGSVFCYFQSVARMLVKETFTREARRNSALRLRPPQSPRVAEDQAWQIRLECLHTCMAGLSAAECELVVAYYRGELGEKIQNRKELAASLGIPMNALRIRVHRLRERLERCMQRCHGAGGAGETLRGPGA